MSIIFIVQKFSFFNLIFLGQLNGRGKIQKPEFEKKQHLRKMLSEREREDSRGRGREREIGGGERERERVGREGM